MPALAHLADLAEPQEDPRFIPVAALDDLVRAGKLIVKVGRKQILLMHTERGVYACNNRCPHEGYPLKEGTVSEGCVLTCNWHNWKFDLASGKTLVGGDKLRRYPVRVADGQVCLGLSDPPGSERTAAALASLKDSFRRLEYDRMAREIARLGAAGGDPLEAVRAAIRWTHDRLEFGTTHAQAAAPDWLALREGLARSAAERLVPVTEIVGHLAWDSLREPAYPFPAGVADYVPEALVQAIEREDEAAAVAQVRGALAAGLGFADLERPLAQAALAHYADFGHSAIYVVKTGQLIERLGEDVAEPLLMALVRSLIYAFREDLIPEFRTYGATLAAWDRAKSAPPPPAAFRGLSPKRAMAKCLEGAGAPEALYDSLLGAVAWQLLHFDTSHEARSDGPVSRNVGWLTLTHGVTFANAVRRICTRTPELWPQGLLQIACFVGRNNGFVDPDLDAAPWRVEDPKAFFQVAGRRRLDHGQFEYIVACHQLKLMTAARDEWTAAPDAPWVPDLLAAVKRFLETPIKRKHTLRTARQSLDFVALGG
jgi:nitrite reductase/ring-hydroxylating ferredoxin subunit